MGESHEADIEIEGFIKRSTAKAILVKIDDREHWLPHSEIDLPDGWRIGPNIFLASSWILSEKGIQ